MSIQLIVEVALITIKMAIRSEMSAVSAVLPTTLFSIAWFILHDNAGCLSGEERGGGP